jgi:Na+/melibiose symporter-like transporter
VLIFAFLATLTYSIIEGPGRGWGSPLILGLFAVSAASIVAFVAYEQRRVEPLIDPRFFRSLPFSGATVIAVCAFGALAGFLFMNTLYLQNVRGYSPLHAGLLTVPVAFMTIIFAPISGRIVGRRGTRLPLLVAGIGITAAGLMLTRLTNTTPLWWLLTTYFVFGLGFAMVNAPITNTAVSGMPRAQAGVAAAIASTSRQVGSTLGVAIIGSAVVSGINGQFQESFSQASHIGWWIVAASGVVVLGLGLASSGTRAAASAAAVRERLMSTPIAAPEEVKAI